MKRYRCDDCDYECRLEIADDADQPDSCVITGNLVDWVHSIVIQTPENKQLRAAEDKVLKLQEALIGVIGSDEKAEMEAMIDVLQCVPGPESIVTVRAIKTLIETKWPDENIDNKELDSPVEPDKSVDKINDDPEDWK